MGLAKVQLTLTPGASSIVVEGHDISDVCRRVVVEASAGRGAERIPVVYLELNAADVDLDVEGVVRLQPESDPAEAVRSFVASLSPEEVEAGLLDRMGGLGAETTTGEALVALLKELADGDE